MFKADMLYRLSDIGANSCTGDEFGIGQYPQRNVTNKFIAETLHEKKYLSSFSSGKSCSPPLSLLFVRLKTSGICYLCNICF